MYKSAIVVLLVAVFAFSALPVVAESIHGTHEVQSAKETNAALQGHRGRGVVNNVDLVAGKVNISHDAIKSLQWPKMTMDFRVQNISTLGGVKPGMKVDFELAKFADGYRITRIMPAKE